VAGDLRRFYAQGWNADIATIIKNQLAPSPGIGTIWLSSAERAGGHPAVQPQRREVLAGELRAAFEPQNRRPRSRQSARPIFELSARGGFRSRCLRGLGSGLTASAACPRGAIEANERVAAPSEMRPRSPELRLLLHQSHVETWLALPAAAASRATASYRRPAYANSSRM